MDSRFVLKRKRHLNSNSGAVAESIIPGVTMTYDNCNTPLCVSKPPSVRKAYVKAGLVQGIGRNDSPKPVKVNGKVIKSYATWKGVLERCYCLASQAKNPTYIGCTVAEEWHSFSTFERWYLENYIEGYFLDKDILVPGNKVYSAAFCVFVPKELNNLLNSYKARRGNCPLGVCYSKEMGKYLSTVCQNGSNIHLGYYLTALEAHRAYQLAKANIIENFPTDNLRVRAALDRRAAKLRDDALHNRITTSL